MKLSLENIMRLSNGLGQLDFYEKVVKQGETERVVKVYYKLTPGFILAMAMNTTRCTELISVYQRERNALVGRYTEGGSKVPDEKIVEFNNEDFGLLDSVHVIKLTKIKESDLNLDNNPIPISVLAMLKPILWKQPEPTEDDNTDAQ